MSIFDAWYGNSPSTILRRDAASEPFSCKMIETSSRRLVEEVGVEVEISFRSA